MNFLFIFFKHFDSILYVVYNGFTCCVVCCFWVLEIKVGPPSLPSAEIWLELGELSKPLDILEPPLLSLNEKKLLIRDLANGLSSFITCIAA